MLARASDGSTTVYDERAGTTHRLDATTAFVWRHADGRATDAELAGLLARTTRTTSGAADVAGAVRTLQRAGLLSEPPARGATWTSMSRREMIGMGLTSAAALMLPACFTDPGPTESGRRFPRSAPTGPSGDTGVPGDTGQPVPCSIRVWLNAFIPSYTRDSIGLPATQVPASLGPPYAGKWVFTHPTNKLHYVLTDSRDFDARWGASSRLTSWIDISLAGARPTIITSSHSAGDSIEFDFGYNVVCNKNASTNRTTWIDEWGKAMRWHNVRNAGASTIRIDLTAAAGNPCVTPSPDIDYQGTLSVTQIGNPATGARVEFVGMVDDYPAYEMYAVSMRNIALPGVKLFTQWANASVLDLRGKATTPVATPGAGVNVPC